MTIRQTEMFVIHCACAMLTMFRGNRRNLCIGEGRKGPSQTLTVGSAMCLTCLRCLLFYCELRHTHIIFFKIKTEFILYLKLSL